MSLPFIMCVCRKLDDRTYDKLSNEVLDELAEFFEDLGDSGLSPTDYDVTLAVCRSAIKLSLYSTTT